MANSYSQQIDIKHNQVLGFFYFQPISEITAVESFGDFSELGLPTKSESKVLSIIKREDLAELTAEQFKVASDLFLRYKHIFAKDDFDLGCATNAQHVLDTGDSPPIRSRPHRRAQAKESIITEELNKLLDSGMIIPSNSP